MFQSSSPSSNGVSENSSNKRLKSSDAEEDLNNDLVSKVDPQNDSVKSRSVEESKSDVTNPASGEDPVIDYLKYPMTEEPQIDWAKSPTGEELKKNAAKSPKEERTDTSIPVDDDMVGQNALLEKSPMRFTPSVLKPEAVLMEASETAASSGSSAVLEDACKNETTAKNNGKTATLVSSQRTPPKNNLGMKMSKQIPMTKFPANIQELLETGILEGLGVKYIFPGNKKVGLHGMIKDGGILCSCTFCKGCKVVAAFQFEKHAGSTNNPPSETIYLENGNSLCEVLLACKDAPLDGLEAMIRSAVCSSLVKKVTTCQNCNGSLPASCTTRTELLCNSCLKSKRYQTIPACVDGINARLSKPVLTPKSFDSDLKPFLAHNKRSQGKITRKDLRLHKLVFEEDGLPDGTELAYYCRGEKLLEGYKKGYGIFCRCCESEVSPSQFEAHAGCASRRKPYLNIYTSNGVSLHELSISLSRSRKLSVNDNDDLCSICAEFGDLLLCDGCPRAFHKNCLDLSNILPGKWYCPFCLSMYQREKSCVYNVNAKAAGRVSGVDSIEQISNRCIRIVKTAETEYGGCVLCRCGVFSKSGFSPRTIILCDQCEKGFHVGCLKDHGMEDLKELPKGKWFCCTDCSRIHIVLQKLLVRGSEKLPDSMSDVIKKKCEEKDSNNGADLDIRWSLLNGRVNSSESRFLLSKAVAILRDRFDPIVDPNTGHDLIPSMVYGRNTRDEEFGGMYCAVLTVNSSVVSAAILRIFGLEVAEIPIVATCGDKQGKGYFQSLLSCIERLLGFLNVRNLVLPAADAAESIWTDKFGFKKITQDQLSEYRKNYPLRTFQGTSMLHKLVPRCRIISKSTKGS